MCRHFKTNIYQCSQCVDPLSQFTMEPSLGSTMLCTSSIENFFSPFCVQLVRIQIYRFKSTSSLLFAAAEFSYLSCTSEEGIIGKCLLCGLRSGLRCEIGYCQDRSSCILPWQHNTKAQCSSCRSGHCCAWAECRSCPCTLQQHCVSPILRGLSLHWWDGVDLWLNEKPRLWVQ